MTILWWGLKTALELYSITGNCVLRQSAEGSAWWCTENISIHTTTVNASFGVIANDVPIGAHC